MLQGLPSPGAFDDADLTISVDGTLWYVTGQNAFDVEPVWVSRSGTATAVKAGWSRRFTYPELSPDGTRVAFGAEIGNETQLWIRRLDKSTEAIFTREGAVNFRPSWSSDGRSVAYISDRGRNYDILVQPADQSAQPKLLLGRDSEMSIWEVVYPRSGPQSRPQGRS